MIEDGVYNFCANFYGLTTDDFLENIHTAFRHLFKGNIKDRDGRRVVEAMLRFPLTETDDLRGSRNESYAGMLSFLTEEERAAQEAFMQELIETVLPETDDLEAKYPVMYPATIDTAMGEQMKNAILRDFDAWNSGYDAWCAWADEIYTADVMYDYRGSKYDLAGLKETMKSMVGSEQRVRINNILISEDWAAIHFWSVAAAADGSRDAWNHMQFIQRDKAHKIIADADTLATTPMYRS